MIIVVYVCRQNLIHDWDIGYRGEQHYATRGWRAALRLARLLRRDIRGDECLVTRRGADWMDI